MVLKRLVTHRPSLAGKGDIHRVKECIRKRGKRELYKKEPGGWTPLHKAARCGKLDMVRFLLESGAVSTNRQSPSLLPEM
jgi:hypothetical protein